MATDVQTVTGIIEIVDVSRPTTAPQIIEQTATIVEVVSAGPQGPAGRDGTIGGDTPVIFDGGNF